MDVGRFVNCVTSNVRREDAEERRARVRPVRPDPPRRARKIIIEMIVGNNGRRASRRRAKAVGIYLARLRNAPPSPPRGYTARRVNRVERRNRRRSRRCRRRRRRHFLIKNPCTFFSPKTPSAFSLYLSNPTTPGLHGLGATCGSPRAPRESSL